MNIIKTYPRLLTLILTFIVAYIIVHLNVLSVSGQYIFFDKHVDLIIAGIMYSFGLTAAFGTAILYSMPVSGNVFYDALIAAIGSLVSDLILFWFFRAFFTAEIRLLFRTRLFVKLHTVLSYRVRKYLSITFGVICIASPLPDEIGVFIISTFTKIKEIPFAFLSVGLNYVGILIVLLLR